MLTDGTHLLRARCGNRIADSRQAIQSDNEPAPEVLDALRVSADGLLDLAPNLSNTLSNPLSNTNTSARVTNFTAPAATLLASSAQAVTPFPAHAAPDLVSLNTGRFTSLPAALSASAQAAPAVPGKPSMAAARRRALPPARSRRHPRHRRHQSRQPSQSWHPR